MKPFDPKPEALTENGVSQAADEEAIASEAAGSELAGDRGIPALNRARSVQSRLSSLLAVSLMSVLGLGLLTWYYSRALTRPAEAHQAAQAAVKQRAQGEMALPSLGHISPPVLKEASPPPSAPMLAEALGPPPPPPVPPGALPGSVITAPMPTAASPEGNSPKSPAELALERKLAGPAFATSSSGVVGGPGVGAGTMPAGLTRSPEGVGMVHGEGGAGSGQTLTALLQPTITPAQAAAVLPTRRFLLAKGAFIDCTLETAIDSTLPGMTTCVTATDTFSADGTVVLLERGTKLVGETRGEVQQGSSRIFVLWSEARTPTGVIVPLSSPGTDELGRSGLSGQVDRHFWNRFGAAILLTVINGAVQGAVNSRNSSGSVTISPSTSTDVMTDVLRTTVNIPPTVTKAQGDRIQVFVARDVDFRSVYDLRVSLAHPGDPATPASDSTP
jgi:type IV secretion system protein VirB10